jgi:hypothetical protein
VTLRRPGLHLFHSLINTISLTSHSFFLSHPNLVHNAILIPFFKLYNLATYDQHHVVNGDIMAILPAFPGLLVEVVVSDTALQEYNLPEDSEETTTNKSTIKYIEAKPGLEFAVRFSIERNFEYIKNDIHFDVTLDGNKVFRRRVLLQKERHTRGLVSIVDGVKLDSGKNIIKRNFVFSTLTTGQLPHFFNLQSDLD